jgi:hypothetical protein
MPENTVSVTRPGKWGNPFRDTPENALTAYRQWLNGESTSPAIRNRLYDGKPPPTKAEIKEVLRGKNLACFCKEGDPCHADILLEIANSA